MRAFVLAASLAALCATAAFAGDEVMAGYYGNTTVATGGMADTRTNYNADHTFLTKVPAFSMEFKGKWKVDGTNLCRTYETPPPGVTNPLCTPIEAHKVGDTWTVTANGQTRTVTLVKGIQ
jgi:opacity protein-like surface antigen